MAIHQELKRLEGVAKNLGYEVVYCSRNRCVVDHKIITLDSRQSAIHKVFALAHEIGHAKTLQKCKKELKCLTREGNDRSWSTLESEFRAWAYADNLVRNMAMYSRDYLKFKHFHFGSYYRF